MIPLARKPLFVRARHAWVANRRALSTALAIACAALSAACAPLARPLVGSPTRVVLPPTAMAAGSQILRFTWTYKDETFEANGDGAVRAQAPDRARLDFFLSNGMAGGYAILVGDSLLVPGFDLIRRVLPPVPLLWCSLGRLVLPPTRDTIARIDGDTLRADLGVLRGGDASASDGAAWRLAFTGNALVRVERIQDSKIVEWMSRQRGGSGQWQLQYVHERGKRRLTIAVTDTTTVEGFDAAIWRRP